MVIENFDGLTTCISKPCWYVWAISSSGTNSKPRPRPMVSLRYPCESISSHQSGNRKNLDRMFSRHETWTWGVMVPISTSVCWIFIFISKEVITVQLLGLTILIVVRLRLVAFYDCLSWCGIELIGIVWRDLQPHIRLEGWRHSAERSLRPELWSAWIDYLFARAGEIIGK